MAGIKLPIEKVRKRMVSFRCSDDEHKRVQTAASTADLPLSDWVRDTVLEAAEATPPKLGRAAKWVAGGEPVVPEPAVLVSEGWPEPWPIGPGDIVTMRSPTTMIEPPSEPPDFKAAVAEEWREIPLASHSPWPQPELLPHVDLDELKTEPAEVPLGWADHWAAMERMEPKEATEKLYELAAGRKFPDGFRSWLKARKIEWLEASWPL